MSGTLLAAVGFVVAVVCLPVAVLAGLAAFDGLVWLAGLGVVAALVMVGVGYVRWRGDTRD